jgi:hypothetical protein
MSIRLSAGLLFTAILAACQAAPSSRQSAADAATPRSILTPASTASRPAGGTLPPGTTVVLPPIDADAPGSIPPELLDALRQMTAEDFKTREHAVDSLELAMTHQFQQMVQVQDLLIRVQEGLAGQLAQMSQSPDPDNHTRVAGLMEFNNAVSRWAVDVMALPDAQRETFMKWGIRDENLPLIARAYNRKPEVRAKVARDIAKIPGPEADRLLVQLLNDRDREVSLTTIDAIAERPPSPPIMDVLWDHAVSAAVNQFRPRPSRQKNLTIRGRTVVLYDQDPNANPNNSQDVDFAVDVLIGYKSDEVTDRLNKLFKDMTSSLTSNNDYRWRVISPNYGEGGRALSRLMEAYKPREAIPFLLKVLAMENTDGYDTTVNNNEKVRYSSRIDAAALLLKSTGQDPADYNIRKYANFGDRWLLKGGQPEENEMIKKLQAWGRAHHKDYAATAPATAVPTTTPQIDMVIPK